MDEVIEKLANHAVKVTYDDVPHEVIYEMKRTLLDSVGCAFGGHSVERGSIAVELAKELGGAPESTILGTGTRVSRNNAALANGELITALDFDVISHIVVHDAPVIIPAILALAECTRASGKDLLLAMALGFDISGRLKLAVQPASPVTDTSEGERTEWPEVLGYALTTLAAAAASGKVLKLSEEQMANAMGIAGYICPPNVFRKWTVTAPGQMTKYGICGWGAQGGITAALLAEKGYKGDTDLFNSDFGFWRYTGLERRYDANALGETGTKWYNYEMTYKQYPCGG
jgi:2-methylcitrate dehydratase PrpD